MFEKFFEGPKMNLFLTLYRPLFLNGSPEFSLASYHSRPFFYKYSDPVLVINWILISAEKYFRPKFVLCNEL